MCPGNGRVRHREFAMASGEMSEPEFTQFLSTTLGLAVNASRDVIRGIGEHEVDGSAANSGTVDSAKADHYQAIGCAD